MVGSEVRETVLRTRLIEQAADLTTRVGWAAVTMARLADEVGVSRQTVYNEVGGKPALAEAMVLRELERFLDLVSLSFADAADDVVEAIRLSARGVLEEARVSPLLRAVLSTTHGAQSELLPLLTTRSETLLATATDVLHAQLDAYAVGLETRQLDAVIDMVVRLVLSHVMAPTGSPDATAVDIAWIAGQVLRPEGSA